MNRSPVILALCLLALAPAAPAALLEGAVVFYLPVQAESSLFGCDAASMEAKIVAGADTAGLARVSIRVQSAWSDDPFRWTTDFRDLLRGATAVYLDTHGNAGGHAFEYFLTPAARDTRLAEYLDTYGAGFYTASVPMPAIGITDYGIQNHLAPHLDSSVALVVTACWSALLLQHWGTFSAEEGGSAYLGYNYEPDARLVCDDLEAIVDAMSCYSYAHGRRDINNSIQDAFAAAQSGLPLLAGWGGNRWRDDTDCKGRAVTFVDCGAFSGAVHWMVSNEQRWTYYEVHGFRASGGDPDLLGTVDGSGLPSRDEIRVYELPVSDPGYVAFQVVEIDDALRPSASQVFSWGEEPQGWPEEATVSCAPAPLEPAAGPLHRLEAGTGLLVPLDRTSIEDCADALIYTDDAHAAWAGRVWLQVALTTNPVTGRAFRPLVLTGGSSPLDARAAFRRVSEANRIYNSGHPPDPYPYYPQLYLVGDGSEAGVANLWWDDGPVDVCLQPICRSWALITDLNHNLAPEGDVSVIPASTYEEVQIACESADDWNANRYVDPGRALALFLGDRDGLQTAPWLVQELEPVRWAFDTSGHPLLGQLLESDFGYFEWERMGQAGAALLNQGLSYVWLAGLNTAQNNFTAFLSGEQLWTRRQRLLGFGPSCEIGATWWPENWRSKKIKDLVFHPLEGTVFAGVIGQVNGAYGPVHEATQEALLRVLSEAPAGTPLATIAGRAARLLPDSYADLRGGIQAFGALVLTKGPLASEVPEAPAVPSSRLDLRAPAVSSGRTVRLAFSLPQSDEIRLEVFDVRGRRVARPVDGEWMGAGEHEAEWNSASCAGGIYFARLACRSGGTVSRKLVITH